VRLAVGLEQKIRVTGGEPLVRQGVETLWPGWRMFTA
jgi:molybdenum cofactor biosynthesis enzyme MoaA